MGRGEEPNLSGWRSLVVCGVSCFIYSQIALLIVFTLMNFDGRVSGLALSIFTCAYVYGVWIYGVRKTHLGWKIVTYAGITFLYGAMLMFAFASELHGIG